MARIEEIDRRLHNWARWKCSPGTMSSLGYATIDYTRWSGRAGTQDARIPTLACEAEETDRGVLALPSELRATVEVYYLHGGGMKQKARKLCCTEAAIYHRLDRAHRKLQQWLAELAERRQAERERVQQIVRVSRP